MNEAALRPIAESVITQTKTGFLSAEVIAGRISYETAAFGVKIFGPIYGQGLTSILRSRFVRLNVDPAVPNVFGSNSVSRSGIDPLQRRVEAVEIPVAREDGSVFAVIRFPGAPDSQIEIRAIAGASFDMPLPGVAGGIYSVTRVAIPTDDPVPGFWSGHCGSFRAGLLTHKGACR